jgi:endonuclease/exonuclease/phosphatase family metal-dependent hydrolase
VLQTVLILSMVCSSLTPASEDFGQHIWSGDFSSRVAEAIPSLKLLSWNIERGLRLQAVSETIADVAPDLLLLQEADRGARRTQGRNVPEELARRFRLNYVFAAEFEELGQRTGSAPACQGQAILTWLPIKAARILRFEKQSGFWRPRWFIPNWSIFQRRLGGRLALVAEIGAREGPLVVYNVHLESRGAEGLRLSQLEEVLTDVGRYSPATPIVIAGDFNTRTPSSPVIHRLEQAGLRKALGGQVTTKRGAALDWIFLRGDVRSSEAGVHDDVKASDHYPLTVRLSQSH